MRPAGGICKKKKNIRTRREKRKKYKRKRGEKYTDEIRDACNKNNIYARGARTRRGVENNTKQVSASERKLVSIFEVGRKKSEKKRGSRARARARIRVRDKKEKRSGKKQEILIKGGTKIKIRGGRKKVRIYNEDGKFLTGKIEASKKNEYKNKITADDKRKNAFSKAVEENNKGDYTEAVADIKNNNDEKKKKFKVYVAGVQQQKKNNNYNNTVNNVAGKYNKTILKIKNKICDIEQQATTEKNEYYINNVEVDDERKISIVFKPIAKNAAVKSNYNKRILHDIERIKRF